MTVPLAYLDVQEDKENLIEILTGGDLSSKHMLHYTTNSLVVADEEVSTIS